MAKEDIPRHGGRFQAQGGGLEESEAWDQEEPLTISDGNGLNFY